MACMKSLPPRKKPPIKSMASSCWESVGQWYHGIVGDEGHYYHKNIILPGVLRLLCLQKKSQLLDLGCGQGILAKHLPDYVKYTGIDASATLIKEAQRGKHPQQEFFQGDVSRPLKVEPKAYSHATVILALQNIEAGEKVIQNAAKALQSGGKLLLVLNHPCFRIPRQSSWGIDEVKKTQYRRLERYMSPLQIPIQMHPGRGNASASTVSFHHPLSTYSQWLAKSGFQISAIEEWCSDKSSTGKNAKMENRSREEFPLFMTLLASLG